MINVFSVPNLSNDIRWSLDLRWQNPAKPFGQWGLKKGVTMRLASDPNLKVDWETFEAIDRHEAAVKEYKLGVS